jgi:tRNA (guanine-N7-)-methyltransferase
MKEQDQHGLKFYGRRKGKPLRKGRASAYETVMDEIRITLPEDGALPDLFPGRETWLEIGFGDGAHLAHMALNNPDVGFIGCEPFVNGVAALCRDIRDKGIKNIRIWPDDARLLLARLKDKSVGRCFLLNSDPWPKTRHHKRRFIQQETLDELHRILKPGAELRMSSDHPSLTAWQLEKAYFHAGFTWNARRAADWKDRPADMPETRYQKKGAGQGRPTVFLSFSASG